MDTGFFGHLMEVLEKNGRKVKREKGRGKREVARKLIRVASKQRFLTKIIVSYRGLGYPAKIADLALLLFPSSLLSCFKVSSSPAGFQRRF